jgi:mono/diheme cytochrome c family protein
MNPALKRLLFAVLIVIALVMMLELWAYDVIKIDFISFMENQASFAPMEDPLPVATLSIPIEGPVAISGEGSPINPVPADDVSVARGRELFTIDCMQCHGAQGQGDGTIANFIVHKPSDLTGGRVIGLSDGAIFLTISNGVPGRMPALNENLTVRERWDVVNFIRKVIQQSQQPTQQP